MSWRYFEVSAKIFSLLAILALFKFVRRELLINQEHHPNIEGILALSQILEPKR